MAGEVETGAGGGGAYMLADGWRSGFLPHGCWNVEHLQGVCLRQTNHSNNSTLIDTELKGDQFPLKYCCGWSVYISVHLTTSMQQRTALICCA